MDLTPLACHADVTHGSDVVTVTDAVLTDSNCRPNAQVFLAGAGYFVVERLTTTTFQTERNYEGATDATGTLTCSIAVFTPEMSSRLAISQQLRDYDARSVLIAQNEAGLSYAFSAATVGAPGDRNVALDNADPSLATVIRLNNADLSGQPVTDRIDRWAIGDEVTIRATDGSGRITFSSTAVPIDEGGYRQVAVTYVGAAGTVAPGADVTIERIAKGTAGALSGIEVTKTAGFTFGASDTGKTFILDAATAQTAAFVAAATLGSTWMVLVKVKGAGKWTFDPNGAETIDGATTIAMAQDVSALISCDGTLLRTELLSYGSTAARVQANLAAAGPLGGRKSRLVNGGGSVNQRAVTSATDDTYAWDRHNVLTQTAAVGISTVADVQNGLPHMMRLTQSQATAQRMGNSQIIESVSCKDLRGSDVTLLGKLRYSNAAAVRYAILEWTGTADSVTSDVVNDWTSGTYTAANFFLGSNLTVTAVGSLTPAANTVTDFSLKTTLGNSTNNLIVMIWTEGTAVQTSTLDAAWELIKGDATAQSYPTEFRPYALELAQCLRRYRHNFQAGTAPVDNAGAAATPIRAFSRGTTDRFAVVMQALFQPPMAAAPTMTFFNPTATSSTNKIYDEGGGASRVVGDTVVTANGWSIGNLASGQTTTASSPHTINYVAESEL